jgi:hypothetical protein
MSDAPVPPPPPEAEASPRWFGDKKAEYEAEKWVDEGKLRGQREKNDLLWLRVYGFLVVSVTVFFTLLFVMTLGTWTWHYLVSPEYGWLTEAQLSKIQSIIFSGSLGAIVSGILHRQLAK